MRFRALDGWRGIAAMLGVLYHWPIYGHHYANFVVRNAYLFVDFFFVLSGFLISYAYADRITSPQTAFAFLFRRFARLWPLHVAMLVMFIGLEFVKTAVGGYGMHFRHEAFTGPHSIDSLVANLFLVHSLGLYDHLTWNSPSWSDSVQFWGYAVFASVVVLGPRRTVVISIIGGIGAGVVIGALSKHVPVDDITYDYGGLRCLLGLGVGHLTYQIYRKRHAAVSMERPWGSPRSAPEVLTLVALFGFIYTAGTGYLTLASPLIFAVVIYVFAHEQGIASRLLQSRPLQQLGRWSYAIYLTHLMVITGILELCHLVERAAHVTLLQETSNTPPGALVLQLPHSEYLMDAVTFAYVAIVIAFAAIMHRLVEVPCRDWLNRFIQGRVHQPTMRTQPAAP